MSTPMDGAPPPRGAFARAARAAAAAGLIVLLGACGGGAGGPGGTTLASVSGAGGEQPPAPAAADRPGAEDAARFLAQATFGIRSVDEIEALRADGYERWLWRQFNAPTMLHTSYLDWQRQRDEKQRAKEEMSYEAVWHHWLNGEDQLRARVAFALSQVLVISNIAPDLRPYAMSSYMDLLNRNAFGNYRTLLEEVTLHPAMGYYLNMVESEKDDDRRGIHPNENYAREVLQLFSIGLVQLNTDGSTRFGSDGKPLPTYGEAQVKGFARAFSGWTFASQDPADDRSFHKADQNLESNWTTPMRAFPSRHSPGEKTLLDGTVLPAGQSPEKDLADALDNIFDHPNVGPFIGRRLIQRLVTSNPSPAYIARVARRFNDNGAGVRGDLRAVVRAVLLDPEARDVALARSGHFGKQREPVIRFAGFLRGLGAKSASGVNAIHDLDGSDDGLGQSPLLAPSVFNFYAPDYRQAGAVARAGLVAPEFQITTETTVVGSLNFFASRFKDGGYGWGDNRLAFDYAPLEALAKDPAALTEHMNRLFFALQMTAATRARMEKMLAALPSRDARRRVRAALTLTSISPDFVIQK